MLREIGRLVRACAEIEDCIFIAITALCEINEGKSTVLLGRVAISTALVKVQQLTKQYAPQLHGNLSLLVKNYITELLQARNGVVHGVYIGCKDGQYSFLSNIIFEPIDEQTHKKVFSYTEKYIASCANVAEEVIEKLVDLYGIPVLRAGRYKQHLVGLPPLPKKAQQQAKKAKPPHPPRSSRK